MHCPPAQVYSLIQFCMGDEEILPPDAAVPPAANATRLYADEIDPMKCFHLQVRI